MEQQIERAQEMPESAAWDFELHAQFEYEAALEAESDDHDRRFSDLYDTLNGDMEVVDIPF